MGELSAEAVTKLLCTLPGIEQGIIAVVQTLATLATESADQEARMKRKIGELAAEVKDLKQELVSLKNSAIAMMKAKTANNSSPAPTVQADVQQKRSRQATTGATAEDTGKSAPGIYSSTLEQRNTADQQQQQKKRQEEHQKTQESQHQESTPEEHQHLQTEQQNLHTASSDSQCPASSDSQCPASNDSQCPASSDSQCPASNDSQSPASSDVQQDSGQHQPKLQDTSTTSAPAKATPPRPGKRHAEDSPGSMSGIPCKMQPSSSSQ
ncbi:ras-interacting protein RIP3-like [Sycon ciliatum]|uniref:ras-interacting protein RIP3-like n=1 Tax=Sycon ciliatum TaxID=27933 RepID=UPI0031F6E626